MLTNGTYPLQVVLDGMHVRMCLRLVIVVATGNGSIAFPCRGVFNFVRKEAPFLIVLKQYGCRQFPVVKDAVFRCGACQGGVGQKI